MQKEPMLYYFTSDSKYVAFDQAHLCIHFPLWVDEQNI